MHVRPDEPLHAGHHELLPLHRRSARHVRLQRRGHRLWRLHLRNDPDVYSGRHGDVYVCERNCGHPNLQQRRHGLQCLRMHDATGLHARRDSELRVRGRQQRNADLQQRGHGSRPVHGLSHDQHVFGGGWQPLRVRFAVLPGQWRAYVLHARQRGGGLPRGMRGEQRLREQLLHGPHRQRARVREHLVLHLHGRRRSDVHGGLAVLPRGRRQPDLLHQHERIAAVPGGVHFEQRMREWLLRSAERRRARVRRRQLLHGLHGGGGQRLHVGCAVLRRQHWAHGLLHQRSGHDRVPRGVHRGYRLRERLLRNAERRCADLFRSEPLRGVRVAPLRREVPFPDPHIPPHLP